MKFHVKERLLIGIGANLMLIGCQFQSKLFFVGAAMICLAAYLLTTGQPYNDTDILDD